MVGLWPGSCLHALRALAHPRWEDFEYVYLPSGGGDSVGGGERGGDSVVGSEVDGKNGGNGEGKEGSKNRLYWLGNGMTWCEENMQGDRKCLLYFLLLLLLLLVGILKWVFGSLGAWYLSDSFADVPPAPVRPRRK